MLYVGIYVDIHVIFAYLLVHMYMYIDIDIVIEIAITDADAFTNPAKSEKDAHKIHNPAINQVNKELGS